MPVLFVCKENIQVLAAFGQFGSNRRGGAQPPGPSPPPHKRLMQTVLITHNSRIGWFYVNSLKLTVPEHRPLSTAQTGPVSALLGLLFVFHCFLASHLRRRLALTFIPARRLDRCHYICLLPGFAPGQMPSAAVPASSQHCSSGKRRSNNLWSAGSSQQIMSSPHFLILVVV